MEIATRTTSVAHLGTKRFGSLLVPLPPLEEQAKIAEIHDEIIDALATAEKKLAVLIRAKKAVMSDLLTGRVRVAA